MRYSWYNYSTYCRLTEFNNLLRKRETEFNPLPKSGRS